jgi:methionine synthase II (cobalamin-independent)
MENKQPPRNLFEPCCLPTTIGSMPHRDVARATSLMLQATPELPSWVQFPRMAAEENMMIQFTEGMPGRVRKGDRVVMDASGESFTAEMTEFYAHYLAAAEEGSGEALEYFALSRSHAAGFWEMVDRLPSLDGAIMAKGQVTGPVTLGLNLEDGEGRSVYYDEKLRDVVVKTVAMKALWQVRRFAGLGKRAMMFLDEPALLGFGSHMLITIGREDVIRDINEVAAAVRGQGALSGVHCEENTDWSVLMDTDLDVLDFDAYDHLQAMTLYPGKLKGFFDRGGMLGWGIVPTLNPEAAGSETLDSLRERFERGVDAFVEKGFDRELVLRRALITPSCGMGGVLTEALAERVLALLRDLSVSLRKEMGFA